ncbi:ArdC-like ssDNA-binding domain-containing protein [Helicobacter cetorum]|uniref:N-terminal domain-containing protein n=1 Tax=Helicobacter cetorum (strain ATCC BAA-429 / MIT 00-7128) TaxID=182217 RepID=I0EMG5_HELC0|nr:ArdC-like ssDNA-binding domain-containing protein [Helicobacter cetorum]AFI04134.1 hypothetical protein HCW_04325 [Helicobacter cetorum MIT 00-7128]
MKPYNPSLLEQQKEAFIDNLVIEIASAIKGKYAPFNQNQKAKPHAHNALNGVAFNGLNDLILDIKQAQGNYQSSAWISLADAKKLGADERELDFIFNNKSIPRAKIPVVKTKEEIPVFALDNQGNRIPYLDYQGNQRVDSNGNPMFQFELEPILDKKGNLAINPQTNEPYYKIKTQTIDIEPVLEFKYLYNVEVFQSLDRNKIKPLNPNYDKRAMLFDKENNIKSPIFQDLQNKLYEGISQKIKDYIVAKNNGKNYVVPTKEQNQQANYANQNHYQQQGRNQGNYTQANYQNQRNAQSYQPNVAQQQGYNPNYQASQQQLYRQNTPQKQGYNYQNQQSNYQQKGAKQGNYTQANYQNQRNAQPSRSYAYSKNQNNNQRDFGH